jgi:hypothetical protein
MAALLGLSLVTAGDQQAALSCCQAALAAYNKIYLFSF